jgi:hypothetical protein
LCDGTPQLASAKQAPKTSTKDNWPLAGTDDGFGFFNILFFPHQAQLALVATI